MKPMSPSFCSLGRWHGDPLSREEAARLRARLEARETERLRRGGRGCFACRLGMLIARFWEAEPIADEYAKLAALARRRHSPRARALLELIYGQLLSARRLPGAGLHLEQGFAEGRNLFAPADYFVVLKRHALLRLLPPGEGAAMDLEGLLTTARVIERMGGGRRPR
jgi:hypothetical protein